MSSSSQADNMNFDHVEGEPSTPRSVRNVQDATVEVNFSSPVQVGSFQPTPNGTKYWVPEANNKPVEGTIFDTLELALKAYKAYARELSRICTSLFFICIHTT
ncbi:hypothetical protein Tco_1121750 [Tanacetum coccineum]|uniref:Uncharacterized protein n=1 Tax=Tanacetum coccineum TaxID=301880 RepID=A0ABQ5IZY9_9ASTR